MSTITEFRIGDVRCFDGLQSVKARRITLLVGENGAGKSTALGCYRALAEIANLAGRGEPNYFGRAPFCMGNFDTIARSESPRFTIGGSFEGHFHSAISAITVQFEPDLNNNPMEQRVELEFSKAREKNQMLDIELVNGSRVLRFTSPDFCFDLDYREISNAPILIWLSQYVSHGYIPYDGDLEKLKARVGPEMAEKIAPEFAKLTTVLRSDLPLSNQHSFFVEALDPSTGERLRSYSSVPEHLNNMSRDYLDYLVEMGRKLELWGGISVHSNPDHGRCEVLVKAPSGWQNLVDVGYGVHSILPLLSALYDKNQPTTFLLQQPEVHLHPSSQANLAQIMAESEHQFLIETHSDHIIDRFRICVMEGKLEPDELSIAYFALSADRKSSQIHNLGMDEDGNLSNVPSGYRSFFMEETKRLLGFQ